MKDVLKKIGDFGNSENLKEGVFKIPTDVLETLEFCRQAKKEEAEAARKKAEKVLKGKKNHKVVRGGEKCKNFDLPLDAIDIMFNGSPSMNNEDCVSGMVTEQDPVAIDVPDCSSGEAGKESNQSFIPEETQEIRGELEEPVLLLGDFDYKKKVKNAEANWNYEWYKEKFLVKLSSDSNCFKTFLEVVNSMGSEKNINIFKADESDESIKAKANISAIINTMENDPNMKEVLVNDILEELSEKLKEEKARTMDKDARKSVERQRLENKKQLAKQVLLGDIKTDNNTELGEMLWSVVESAFNLEKYSNELIHDAILKDFYYRSHGDDNITKFITKTNDEWCEKNIGNIENKNVGVSQGDSAMLKTPMKMKNVNKRLLELKNLQSPEGFKSFLAEKGLMDGVKNESSMNCIRDINNNIAEKDGMKEALEIALYNAVDSDFDNLKCLAEKILLGNIDIHKLGALGEVIESVVKWVFELRNKKTVHQDILNKVKEGYAASIRKEDTAIKRLRDAIVGFVSGNKNENGVTDQIASEKTSNKPEDLYIYQFVAEINARWCKKYFGINEEMLNDQLSDNQLSENTGAQVYVSM